MKYKIECFWNKTKVLDGECSAVMAWEILNAFGNSFSLFTKAGYEVPTLVDLNNSTRGTIFTGVGNDGTGEARFTLNALQ